MNHPDFHPTLYLIYMERLAELKQNNMGGTAIYFFVRDSFLYHWKKSFAAIAN